MHNFILILGYGISCLLRILFRGNKKCYDESDAQAL